MKKYYVLYNASDNVYIETYRGDIYFPPCINVLNEYQFFTSEEQALNRLKELKDDYDEIRNDYIEVKTVYK